MKIEEAIKKAIEGGFEEPRSVRNKALDLPYEIYFLDPDFWKSTAYKNPTISTEIG